MEDGEVRLLVISTILVLAITILGNAGTLANFFEKVTGFATSAGSVNVTVDTLASINFTTDTINWSRGRVTLGQDFATLDTAAGTVTGGNWTAVSQGFIIENIGNVNISFNLTFGLTANGLLGGTSPEYKFNITNSEAGSCTPASGFTLGEWNEVTSGSIGICSSLAFLDANDEIRIDFQLKIPSDSYMDSRGDTLTVYIEEVS